MFCWIVLALSESVEFIVVYILCMVEICVGTVEIEKPMGVTEYSRRGIRSRGIDIEREREDRYRESIEQLQKQNKKQDEDYSYI